jgi:hypothetical protein
MLKLLKHTGGTAGQRQRKLRNWLREAQQSNISQTRTSKEKEKKLALQERIIAERNK